MFRKNFKDFDLSKGSDGKAVIMVEHFHFLYGDIFLSDFIFGKKDNSISAFSQGLLLFIIANESAV